MEHLQALVQLLAAGQLGKCAEEAAAENGWSCCAHWSGLRGTPGPNPCPGMKFSSRFSLTEAKFGDAMWETIVEELLLGGCTGKLQHPEVTPPALPDEVGEGVSVDAAGSGEGELADWIHSSCELVLCSCMDLFASRRALVPSRTACSTLCRGLIESLITSCS